jgi:hypothetical protein
MYKRYYDIDVDAKAYANNIVKAGGRIPSDIGSVSDFIKKLKINNLWNSMICWPLRSIHNAGSGTKAYSLGNIGTYDATLINGPVWRQDGILYDGVDDYVLTTYGANVDWGNGMSLFTCFNTLGWSISRDGFATVLSNMTAGAPYPTVTILGNGGVNSSIRVDTNTATTEYYNYSTPITNYSYNMLGFTHNNQTRNAILNNSTYSSISIPTKLGTSTNNFNFGRSAEYGRYVNISQAFVVIFTRGLTTAESSTFYSIYKTTIGKGLGLP